MRKALALGTWEPSLVAVKGLHNEQGRPSTSPTWPEAKIHSHGGSSLKST